MSTRTKRTIKFLAISSDSKIIRPIIKGLPGSNSLIKSICNAALNAARGEISLTDSEKSAFQKHRDDIDYLAKRQKLVSVKNFLLANKNQVILLIPVLLSSVLRSIGTSFIVEQVPRKKKITKTDVCVPQIYPNQSERTGPIEGAENQGVQPEY